MYILQQFPNKPTKNIGDIESQLKINIKEHRTNPEIFELLKQKMGINCFNGEEQKPEQKKDQ